VLHCTAMATASGAELPLLAASGARGSGAEHRRRLVLPTEEQAAAPPFETYKRCPGLLGVAERLPLPPGEEGAAREAPRPTNRRAAASATPLLALEAEARALAPGRCLARLFGGTAVAAALGDGGVAVWDLAAKDEWGAGTCARVRCEAPVLSLVRALPPCSAGRATASSDVGAGGGGADAASPTVATTGIEEPARHSKLQKTEEVAAGREKAEQAEREVEQDVEQEVLVASTAEAAVVVIAVSRERSSGSITARITLAATPHWSSVGEGLAVAVASDAWVTAALRQGSGMEVVALMHRVLGAGDVEVIALSLGNACTCLVSLRGCCLPRGCCWCSPTCALLGAGAGFHLGMSAHGNAAAPTSLAVEQRRVDCESSAIITVLRCMPELHEPGLEHWELPDGELLGAWPEEEAAMECGAAVASSGLSLVFVESFNSNASVLRVTLAPAVGSTPFVEACVRIPAIASLASARRDLRLALVSPARTFVALVEARGRNAVTVFRRPTAGATRSPTAALDLSSGDDASDPEVLGALLSDAAALVLTRHSVARYTLDATARVGEDARPRPPGAAAAGAGEGGERRTPLGLDAKALLRMLDMHGED